MIDSRIKETARILVDYSTKIKKGDIVRIYSEYQARDLAKEVYRLALQRGAYPMLDVGIQGLTYIYYKNASDEQLNHFPDIRFYQEKKTDVFISIYGEENSKELTNIDPKKLSMRQKVLKRINDLHLKKRWVLFEFPTHSLAQEAEMSKEEFEDFVFGATNIDWSKKSKEMDKIKKLFDNAKSVRILGNETDMSFSLEKRKGIKGDGKNNMPDGEVFYAPIKSTVNGSIYYEFPAIYGGREVTGVRLKFKNGKVVEAKAEKNEHFLKEMISADKGSCFVGEFGIGCNYNIQKFTKNILFDEKIGGTVHFALGMAYPECGGGNKSAVHWDMIKDLRTDGQILVNGKVVQKNGKFIFK